MKRNTRSFVILCIIATFSVPVFSFAEDASKEVLKAAQEGLQIFVKELPKNRLPRFGFLNAQDIDDATVGQGFQSFVVASDSLLNDMEDSADLNSLLVPLNNWQFLVMTRDKAAAILTVYLDNDTWKPASIGAVEAASELNTHSRHRHGAGRALSQYQLREEANRAINISMSYPARARSGQGGAVSW